MIFNENGLKINQILLESAQHLDILIFGYLDSGQNNGLMHPQSGLLCGAALPFFFVVPRKNKSLGFCNLKLCFLHSTKTIFNGTRLDRRGLKS